MKDHPSYNTTFCDPVRWSLIGGFTVFCIQRRFPNIDGSTVLTSDWCQSPQCMPSHLILVQATSNWFETDYYIYNLCCNKKYQILLFSTPIEQWCHEPLATFSAFYSSSAYKTQFVSQLQTWHFTCTGQFMIV